jgi:hypothetical protein
MLRLWLGSCVLFHNRLPSGGWELKAKSSRMLHERGRLRAAPIIVPEMVKAQYAFNL